MWERLDSECLCSNRLRRTDGLAQTASTAAAMQAVTGRETISLGFLISDEEVLDRVFLLHVEHSA